MDTVSVKDRSRIMRAVRHENTTPEIKVRKMAHSLGYRFRLHRKDLPGSPDLVFPKHNLCIFVHGCFWHSHPQCKKATVPKSNMGYWRQKFEDNKQRDRRKARELQTLGWKVVIIWECQTRDTKKLRTILLKSLGDSARPQTVSKKALL